ncbi:MAG: undecaprenyl-diphosphate phosphatase [Gallionellaceae bacterium]|jgi:undecaprenyl-diphosphatase|nr:undecaprenyl-diphosphate phosphatase [Gallionellaceae bacterium]
MDILLLLKAAILGVVEGLTEFLPISSTGHLILAGDLLNFWTKEKRDVFEVVIQLGAILAVCYEYRERLLAALGGLTTQPNAQRFTFNVLLAFLPAAVIGFFAIKAIKAYLFNLLVVASAFIIGGLIILWVERRQHTVRVRSIEEMNWRDALKVGFAQCLAMIPGTSRSGATIIGGLFFGLERKVATEFSFFLAIPTMFAATVYDAFKHRHEFMASDLPVFAVGFVVSFIIALFVIRALIRYISQHDFTAFAWYRIVFGIIVLATAYSGMVSWSNS